VPIFSEIMKIVGLRRDRELQPEQSTALTVPILSRQRDLSLALPDEDFSAVMIIGRAGTGKSVLVREMARLQGVNQVVLSPTGIAALNVGGQTIHSFFPNFPHHIIDPSNLEPVIGRRHIYQNLERLIIDEMSMVRADLLDAIDVSLRMHRKNGTPFGGVKVVMIGDFLQLPPVVKNEERPILEDLGYLYPHLVASKVLQNLRVRFVEMTKVYRQNDPQFIQLLGDIRLGRNLESAVNAINRTCYGPHRNAVTPIVLTPRNDEADRLNRTKLEALPSPIFRYKGIIQGSYNLERDPLPVPLYLDLKEGARIIMVRNDPGQRWVNGSLGVVNRTEPNCVRICLDGKTEEYEITKQKWEKIKYCWNQAENRIIPEVVGSYSQLPLKLAWAVTIHKAQGLTLENARIDFGSGAFAPGQAYVALSRVTSLEGLSLVRPLSVADVKVDPTSLDVTEEISRRSIPWVDQ
jgi:ATP-dependent DNA helicase PIF1